MTIVDTAETPPARWTLADILSSDRFWALLGCVVLVSAGFEGFAGTLPVVVMMREGDPTLIGIYHAAVYLGLVPGAAFAFATLGQRRGLGVLALVAFGLIAAVLRVTLPSSVPALYTLLPLAFAQGVLQAGLPVALALLVHSGRSEARDFAAAFSLIVASLIAGFLMPAIAGLMVQWTEEPAIPAWILLTCLTLATALLIPAGSMHLREIPPWHSTQLPLRRRSPLLVALSLILPAATFLGSAAATLTLPFWHSLISTLAGIAILSVVIGLGCLGYWLYRIHAELAAPQASPRLLHPLRAALIGMFVPVGLPILLMMLSDHLRDRAIARGDMRMIGTGWVIFWAVALPPVSAAMVQTSANRAYDFDAGEAALSAGLVAAIAETDTAI